MKIVLCKYYCTDVLLFLFMSSKFLQFIFKHRDLAVSKGKIHLINLSRIFNLEKPIGRFLKSSVISDFLIFELVYNVFKSLSILFLYIWEWITMLSSLFTVLLALYFIFIPNTTSLVASFPMIVDVLDMLDIDHPLTFYEGIKDFIFHPITWSNYYLSTTYDIIYNYLNNIYNELYDYKVFRVVAFLFNSAISLNM